MKKLIFSAALFCMAFGVNAQLVEINSMQRVALPEGLSVNVPTMSPNGQFVVVSDAASNGLSKIDIATGAVSTITNNGSGYDVCISNDGSQVVFRQSSFNKNHLRLTSLKSVSLADGKETQLVAPSRNLNAGAALNGNTVTAVEKGKMRTKRLAGSKEQAAAAVSISYGHLQYTGADGKSITLDPQGRGSYLWPALSPDGTKVVYYLATRGCFVCNIDGSNVKPLGLLRAAKWLDNNTVVGMHDTDNGEFTTASTIIASSLDGVRQNLTDDSLIAMYPSPSADGKSIAFATAQGELFIINLK